MSSPQKALILTAKQGSFVLGARPIPKPGAGQVLIKLHAVALNPVDWKVQTYGVLVQNYPAVLGVDLAGVVEEVGEDVSTFVKGDRVISHGSYPGDLAGFQQYALAVAAYTAKIPAKLSLDQAASVPLGIDTAAVGFYGTTNGISLTAPWKEAGQGAYKDKPLVVLGGSSSVGSYAIQLGQISGFSPIIATASLHNTAYLKSFGATHVIDRHLDAAGLKAEVSKITSKPIEVVYDAIALQETQKSGWGLLAPGGKLILTLPPVIKDDEKTEGREAINVVGTPHLPTNREIGLGVYSSLERWLDEGLIQPNKVEVLPEGLLGVIPGLERLKKDQVSGTKLIIHPQETA